MEGIVAGDELPATIRIRTALRLSCRNRRPKLLRPSILFAGVRSYAVKRRSFLPKAARILSIVRGII